MKFVKESGAFLGHAAGKLIGGTVRVAGELVGSAYVKEIGTSVERATAATGEIVGEAASGVLDAGAGLLTQDKDRIHQGVQDLQHSATKVVEGIGNGVGYVVDSGILVAQGLKDGDSEAWIRGVKQLGKAAAVGALAVGVFELVDVTVDTPSAEAAEDEVAPTDVKTINEGLDHTVHPETGVPYESKVVQLSESEIVQGVFPDFAEAYAGDLPEHMYLASDAAQFDYMNERLAERLEHDGALASIFNDSQLEQIYAGETPDGYVWHHAEEPGRMELVDEQTHASSAHTGGRSLWGGGSEYR